MENQKLLDSNFEIWLYIADLHHKIVLVRQSELNQYNISTRKLHILRLINSLGPEARISAISKALGRKLDVVSRQVAAMESEGLLKRIKAKPKSRLLTLELTEMGREMLKINKYSAGMNTVLSVLSEKERELVHSALHRMLGKLNEISAE
jgi:DNA-binding MarR family transcriptional regulator